MAIRTRVWVPIYAFWFYWKKWKRWCVILSLTFHSRTLRGVFKYLCLKLYFAWQAFQFLRRRMNTMRKSANICILLLHSRFAFKRNENDDFKPNLPPAVNAGRVWPILVCSLPSCCWQSQENWPNYCKWFVISLAIREQLETNLGQRRTNEYKFITWQNGLIMEPHCMIKSQIAPQIALNKASQFATIKAVSSEKISIYNCTLNKLH